MIGQTSFCAAIFFLCLCSGKTCVSPRLDSGLSESFAPGIFFPGEGSSGCSGGVRSAAPQPVLMPTMASPAPRGPQPMIFQAVPQQTPQQYQGGAGGFQQSPGFAVPTQVNTQSTLSPLYTQPLGSQAVTGSSCDSAAGKEKYSECIKNALSTFRKLIESCKNTLGKESSECCVNEECLENIKKKNISDVIEAVLARKRAPAPVSEKRDTLSEFLEFLRNQIEASKVSSKGRGTCGDRCGGCRSPSCLGSAY